MKIGELLDNKFKICKSLGIGGSGSEVYLVEEIENNNQYAAKVYLDVSKIKKSDTEFKRFAREVKMLKGIDHPNIVKILDSNLECDTPYFIMPLYKHSLKSDISVTKDNPALAFNILRNACLGLIALHEAGIIHRDIKPSNILIGTNGEVAIGDLGIGYYENREMSTLTLTNQFLGTQTFMPPEFLTEGGTKHAGVTSDVFQLGKTIYQVFTNLPADNIRINHLPGGISYIVTRALSQKPEERQQSVNEVLNQLNEYYQVASGQLHPGHGFKELLNEIKNKEKIDKPAANKVCELLHNVSEYPDVFFECFIKMPHNIYVFLAKNMSSETVHLLDVTLGKLEPFRSGFSKEYDEADSISEIAQAIFESTKDLAIRIRCLALALFAGYLWHRYSAMGTFNDMLISIQDDKEVEQTAALLRENSAAYLTIANNKSINVDRLHPTLRVLHSKLIK